MFSQFGQPLEKHTPMLNNVEGDGFEKGDTEARARAEGEIADDRKKKSKSQRTAGYNNKEGIILYRSWLFISQDPYMWGQAKNPSVWEKARPRIP
jgi:hypothetical protein